MNSLTKPAVVIAGGGLGSYLRYVTNAWVQSKLGDLFPYGTLTVNLTGAFLIGMLMTVFLKHLDLRDEWRLFLTVGVLGGYTTFSAAAWDSYRLFSTGSQFEGALYILGSVFGGTIALLLGVWASRIL